MREFRVTIEDSLKFGLRREARSSTNEVGLEDASNVKPSKYGLIRCDTLAAKYTTAVLTAASITVVYPYPMLFLGGVEELLLDSTKAYAAGTTPAAITTYDMAATGSTLDPVTGHIWNHLDMNDAWLAVNASCAVIRTNLHNIAGSTFPNKYLVDDNHHPFTVCYHRGRVIQAGWSSGSSHPLYGALDFASVMWSTIGGGDVFLPYLNSCPDYTLDTTWAQKLIDRNEGGIQHLDRLGSILTVVPMGGSVVLYGSNGIGRLVLSSGPVPTYGYEDIVRLGIINRGAATGTNDKHVFVTKALELYTMGADFKPTKLDYGEMMGDLDAQVPIQVMHNPVLDEFHITDGTTGFVLTSEGLGELTHLSTSLSMRAGYCYAVPVTDSTTSFSFCTNPMDMSMQALKRLENVEIGGSGLADIEISVYHRNADGAAFVRTGWKPINAQGWAYIGISGKEFKVAVKGTISDSSVIKYINISYKTSDKRALRGFYQAGRGT